MIFFTSFNKKGAACLVKIPLAKYCNDMHTVIPSQGPAASTPQFHQHAVGLVTYVCMPLFNAKESLAYCTRASSHHARLFRLVSKHF